MLALKASLPGPLGECEEGIRLLHCAFPDQWGIVSQADDEMRVERWERIRRQRRQRVLCGLFREGPPLGIRHQGFG